MKKILIVAPTVRENKNIRLAIERRGEQLKNSYTVAFSGIGKAAAAATLTRHLLQAEQPYDLVAVIGYAAGTLGFKQGEIVVPSGVQYHDTDIPEGFIPEISSALTPVELQTLALGAFTMTVELAVRFLDDYITGDQYFKTNYQGHNLVRTRSQLALADDIYSKLDELNSIVAGLI